MSREIVSHDNQICGNTFFLSSRRGRACEATAGCESFGSSTLKSVTAATAAIQKDMAFGASTAEGVRRFDPRAFATATAHGKATHLYWAKIAVSADFLENEARKGRPSREQPSFEHPSLGEKGRFCPHSGPHRAVLPCSVLR